MDEGVNSVAAWLTARAKRSAPVVGHERFIGCGLPKSRCPAVGEAANRVHVDPLRKRPYFRLRRREKEVFPSFSRDCV